ncbi:MAG: hypothetical protein ACXABY_05165 [Candidatus Thorarchaeota archaeon]|jgi:hypothetical protein
MNWWERLGISLKNLLLERNVCPLCGKERTYWRGAEPTCWDCDLVGGK